MRRQSTLGIVQTTIHPRDRSDDNACDWLLEVTWSVTSPHNFALQRGLLWCRLIGTSQRPPPAAAAAATPATTAATPAAVAAAAAAQAQGRQGPHLPPPQPLEWKGEGKERAGAGVRGGARSWCRHAWACLGKRPAANWSHPMRKLFGYEYAYQLPHHAIKSAL